MQPFAYDHNEEARLAVLKSYNILDTAEEKDFDDLTILASAICQTPIAFIGLIDDNRQWLKSRKGIAATDNPIGLSFTKHTIAAGNGITVIEDISQDERFAEDSLLNGEKEISFYAGVPLINADGFALGSLCVIDEKKKQLTEEQTNALKIIAKQVVDKLELKKTAKELEKIHQELIDSNLFIQKFAAMAAHDIKNPMSNILLTAQLLKVRFAKLDDKNFERLINMNIDSTKRLITLLDDMLAYSRSPELLLTQKQSVNSSELLLLAVSLVQLPDHITISLPAENYLMHVATVALQQILINLLTNAIRYNDKEQGVIQIRLKDDAACYYFEVEDNGIGIAAEHHQKIFNNSFTLKITDQYGKKGSGIGLSTVKELVKAIKGTITLRSTLGQGTTFSFSVPKG